MLNEVIEMAGGQKAGSRRTLARKLVAVGLALACLWVASPAFADFNSDITIKVGASGLFNHRLAARQAIVGLRQAGAHISVDYAMQGRASAISPFLDIYHRVQTDASATRPRNDAATNAIGGVNFIFTGPRSERATMYFGVGGGVARLKVVDVVNVPLPTTRYRSRLMADALIGVGLQVAPGISFFLEPHYVWTTKMLNGLSAHVGLGFGLGRQAKAAPPASPAPPVYVPKAPVQKAPEPVKKVEEVKPSSSAEALATMQEMIYFQHDRSDISDSAKVVLNDKITVFRANPAMRIVIVGFASQPGTEAYNMALGLRRAEAAKAYLVSMGIDPIRIEIATRGEGRLVVEGPGEAADAQNRRDQFRLLIADPYLEAPKK